MASLATTDWVEQLSATGIPCGPINTIDQALADPQAAFRGLVADAGGRPAIASPLRLS